MKPAIVVVTYNRPRSLKRLLHSLSVANYEANQVPLVISVDFQNSKDHDEVVRIAQEYNWIYGEKQVIVHEENLGLRNHVISCGELTRTFDSVIMLEDDIYVSPQFYEYSLQALKFYAETDDVAGISLYKHQRNVNVNRPFYPENNGFDAFLMQFAQSWGQCWSSKMWSEFYTWYLDNQSWDSDTDLPAFVSAWPKSSWLKYFIKYVVKNGKYFVYPYESLSTNFADTGTHNMVDNNMSQVPLQRYRKEYNFPEVENAVKYDVFFEREGLADMLGLDSELCTDLYGSNNNAAKKRYLLSLEALPFKVVRSYGLNFRPHECNAILRNEGADIFLYDTYTSSELSTQKADIELKKLLFDYSFLSRKSLLKLSVKKLLKL